MKGDYGPIHQEIRAKGINSILALKTNASLHLDDRKHFMPGTNPLLHFPLTPVSFDLI